MPTFLITALFGQVMLYAVIWTLEKQCKKKSWCHMYFSKKSHPDRGSCDQKQLQKSLRTRFGAGGKIGDTENTLLYRNFLHLCRKFHSLFQHLGRLSWGGWLMGDSLSTKGDLFQLSRPCLANRRPPSLLWFLFLHLVVSKPLPGIVNALPE